MKNVKHEFEQEIQIKEEKMNDLREKYKVELKNIKQNIIKCNNYKSKKEYIIYLFSLFFSLYTSSFPLCNEKSGEEKILNKGERQQIKIDENKNGSFKDKKLLRKKSKYEFKKANNKRKIFKYNVIIIRYIVINYFNLIFLNNNKFLIESKVSKITLKIKGTGSKYIFGKYFEKYYYPDKIYINGKQNFTITNEYYFDKDDNYVILEWNDVIKNCKYMFYFCSNITEIIFNNFDTSEVTLMNEMFSGCSKLISLDLSNFKTSKVTSMRNMFSRCSQISSLDLFNFDTSKVENMWEMFSGCSKLISLILRNFNISKVTNILSMFYDCSSLSSLDLSYFDTSKVTDMTNMFYGCSQLTYLNLKNFIENNSLYLSSNFDGVPDNIVICINEKCKKNIN